LYVLLDYLQKWARNPPAIKFKPKVDARKKEEKIAMELIESTQPERIVQEKILESIRTLELPLTIFLLSIIDIRSSIKYWV
jgi:hypothetical protein